MRKNFTQLFWGLALILGFTTASNAQCDIPPPAGAFYNFQFDGGLEGWRALDAAGFETTIGWGWNETGDLTEGSFNQPGQDFIESASVCNGAAVMNSDFLDNEGNGVDFIGTGPCPAPCNGYLVSPVMDLSSATAPVALQFTQALRQFFSEFYIYVSVDGGASNLDTIQLNNVNDGISIYNFVNNERTIGLCGIAGESNVVITFHYVADYYFWAIDDVSIIPAPEGPDMRVNRNFYSKGNGNYITPKNMATAVPILADIENLGANESTDPTLNFKVMDAGSTEVFSSSRAYDPVPPCSTDENKVFDASWMLPDEVGDYTVEFEIASEGDGNSDNNIVTAPFKISEREFRKLPSTEEVGDEYLTGVRYGGGFASWGAYFYIPNNDAQQAIESVSLGIITNGEPPSPGFINVGVYQWIDIDENGDADEGERILLGQVDILVEPESPSFMQWTVTPLDDNGELIVPESGAELLILGHSSPFDGVTNYFFNCVSADRYPEYHSGATQLAHREAGLIGGYSSFASQDGASHDDRHDRLVFNIDGFATSYTYDISMLLSGSVGTEDINEDLAIRVFPSPATTAVNIDLNLEEVSEKVSVELMDFSGNRIGQYNYSNIKKERLSIDVSQLTSGMYLINVRTALGMTSRKISIIH